MADKEIHSTIYNDNAARISQGSNGGSSTFRLDRLNLLDKATADDFNTYRNWGAFQIIHEGANDSSGNEKQYDFFGLKPLFNNVNAIGADTNYQLQNNAPLLDAPSVRDQIRARGDCSVRALVKDTEKSNMGRMTYQYSDFMYCKYLGRVSNNYLITLRRFPFPCGDHINYTDPSNADERSLQKHMPDIGRLVTWMGTPGNDMSNILKYNVLMPFKELTAEMQDAANDTAENGGMLGAFMNLANPQYNSMVVKGQAGKSSFGAVSSMVGLVSPKLSGKMSGMSNYQDNSWTKEHDRTKIWGPSADVISKTSMRQDGTEGGLQFEQEISLVFDYELRSYDGINGKAAFLDLLANILAVTYTNGKFWGGGFKSAGASQSNAFANLPIYKLGEKSPVDFHTATDAFMDTISSVGAAFNDGKKISSAGDILNAIKNFGKGVMNTLIGGAINMLGRPQKQILNSLLTPAPVGLWHLTIGNPKHPIMVMGNMILTGVEIEHYGPLGLDDFPTGLKVSVKLKHAKPRDAMQIEQMYMMGDYRIYYPMSGKVLDIYRNASRYKNPVAPSEASVEDTLSSTSGADEVEVKTSQTSTEQSTTSADAAAAEKPYHSKFFGTPDTKLIVMGSGEAAWGSHKAPAPSTPEEIKEQERERARQAEEDKKRQ